MLHARRSARCSSDRLVLRFRLPAQSARHRARARAHLPARVPRRAQPVPGPARRARPASRTPLSRQRRLWRGAEPLPPPLLRSPSPCRRPDGRRLVGLAGPGSSPGRAALASDARVVRPLGPVPLDRERRPAVLRLRLGVAPPRGRVPRDLPRRCPDGAPLPGPRPLPLARLSSGARRRAHQAAGRSVLARSHLHGLPPRDPADAEPAQLVRPPAAAPASTGSRSSATTLPSSSRRSSCSCRSLSRRSAGS